MLIVVVIIGILSTALIPRLTGYMARARDLKRKMDLQNIATAIEAYRNDTWKLPTRWGKGWTEHTWGTFQSSPIAPCETFESALNTYVTSIPKDPQSNSIVRLHRFAVEKYPNYFYGDFKVGKTVSSCHGSPTYRWIQGVAAQPWQYFYQIFKKGGINMWAAIVAAKVETSDFANYVRFQNEEHLQGWLLKHNYSERVSGVWTQKIVHDINDLKFCNSVEKVSKGNEKFEIRDDWNVECKYSSEDQLYYIVKIE